MKYHSFFTWKSSCYAFNENSWFYTPLYTRWLALRARAPNYKVQGHFLQKLELLEWSRPFNVIRPTLLRHLYFLKECLCVTWLKHMIIIEDIYSNLHTQSYENHIDLFYNGTYKKIPLWPSIELSMPLKQSATHCKQKTEIFVVTRPTNLILVFGL